jgi:hypothetical protein
MHSNNSQVYAFFVLLFVCSDGAADSEPENNGTLTGLTESDCVDPLYPPSEKCSVFCPPTTIDVVIDKSDPRSRLVWPGNGHSWSGGGNKKVYQAFTHDSEEVSLNLFFDSSIVGNYSYDALLTTFNYVNVSVTLPDSHSLGYYYRNRGPIYRDDPRMVDLDYHDGWLSGQINLGAITRVQRDVNSNESSCIDGDILGRCRCDYNIKPTPASIRFNLELPSADYFDTDGYKEMLESAVESGYPVQYLENMNYACTTVLISEDYSNCQIKLDQRYGHRVARSKRKEKWVVVEENRYYHLD